MLPFMLICEFLRQTPQIYLFKSLAFDLLNFLIILLIISASVTGHNSPILIPGAGSRAISKRDFVFIKFVNMLIRKQWVLIKQLT